MYQNYIRTCKIKSKHKEGKIKDFVTYNELKKKNIFFVSLFHPSSLNYVKPNIPQIYHTL